MFVLDLFGVVCMLCMLNAKINKFSVESQRCVQLVTFYFGLVFALFVLNYVYISTSSKFYVNELPYFVYEGSQRIYSSVERMHSRRTTI